MSSTLASVLAMHRVLSIQAEVIEPATVSAPDLRYPKDHNVLGTLLALGERHPSLSPADFWAKHAGL
ncbi:MAG: hypothetical protein H4O13_16685 [Xanthomonadales bacterium]|nr:hypothetical protein [Xanthomonadales bacterium]